MHFPCGAGWILIGAFKPEHFAYIGTDKIKITIPIHIMEHAMNTARFHLGIPRLGFRKYKGLVIFWSKIHEKLSFSGEQDLLLTIPSIIISGGGINMRSRIDFLTRPIRILGKKKMGRCKK
jgi:hypothetical protein